MQEVTTKSGFTVAIDERCMDDMELLDDIVDLTAGDYMVYPKIIRRIMSAEDKKRLYDHIRDPETGRVPTDSFGRELTDIFEGLNAGKK